MEHFYTHAYYSIWQKPDFQVTLTVSEPTARSTTGWLEGTRCSATSSTMQPFKRRRKMRCSNFLLFFTSPLLEDYAKSKFHVKIDLKYSQKSHFWVICGQSGGNKITIDTREGLFGRHSPHVSWSLFFCDKKKQRNCTRGSFLNVLLILKTLTFKSGTSILKSYRTFCT